MFITKISFISWSLATCWSTHYNEFLIASTDSVQIVPLHYYDDNSCTQLPNVAFMANNLRMFLENTYSIQKCCKMSRNIMASCNYEFYTKRWKAVQSLIIESLCTPSAQRCHLEPLGELDADLRSSLDLGLPDADFRRWLGELDRSLRLLGEFPAFGLGYLEQPV